MNLKEILDAMARRIPGTSANIKHEKIREYALRGMLLAHAAQKRYPGAQPVWLSSMGQYRREYEGFFPSVFTYLMRVK